MSTPSAAPVPQVELTIRTQAQDTCTQSEANDQDLLPADGGLAAWRLLLAAFVFEALLWGEMATRYRVLDGTLQCSEAVPDDVARLSTLLRSFPRLLLPAISIPKNSYIPVIGTIASGCFYLGAPVMVPLAQRFSKYRRHMIAIGCSITLTSLETYIADFVGGLICILGLLASSFETTVKMLVVTQGVMYGLGFLILCYPILSLLNEFWVVRRGMAYGILCGATGFSGVFLPFALEASLNTYGYPTTLRALSVGLAALTGPLVPLFRSRLPATYRQDTAGMDWTVAKRPLFWVYVVANMLQGFAFLLPLLFLPSHATSIGLSSTQGASLLAIVSVSQMFGQFSFGYLSDLQIPLELLAVLSTATSAVAVLTLWGLGKSFGPLVVFSLLYGFFAAGYVAIWARMGTKISDEPTTALAMFGVFAFGKGIGNVLAGPISAALTSNLTETGEYGATRYGRVIVFTGACMLASAAVSGSWFIKIRLCGHTG